MWTDMNLQRLRNHKISILAKHLQLTILLTGLFVIFLLLFFLCFLVFFAFIIT